MNRQIILIGILLACGAPVCSASIGAEIVNATKIPFVKESIGIHATFRAFKWPIYVGIEHIAFSEHGTVHSSINGAAISTQNQWRFPIGFWVNFSPVKQLRIVGIVGVAMYSKNPVDASVIEAKETISNDVLVTHYNETFQTQPFYKIKLAYRFYNRWEASFSKTWHTLHNKATFRYLDTYTVEKINEFNYDPISMAISYHF